MNHQIDINDRAFLEKRYGKITTWYPGAIDQKTGRINPQVTQVSLGDTTYISLFHVKIVYYETPTGHWRPLSEVTHHHGNKDIVMNDNWWNVHPRFLSWLDKRCKLLGGELLIPSPFKSYPIPYVGAVRSIHNSIVPLKVGLTTSTFYPDPDPETTTTSAACFEDRGTVWTTHRSGTACRVVYANTSIYSSIGNGNGATAFSTIRAFMLFNTASIPDDDIISSATYSGYCISAGVQDGSNIIGYIVSSTPASNTNIITDDYDQIGTIEFGRHQNYTALQYEDYPLNSSGIAAITKTGISKFASRGYGDFNNIAPTDASEMEVEFYNADGVGTSTDPKLVVVHSSAAADFIISIDGSGAGMRRGVRIV
jgi:hypothetical protein